MAAKVLLKWISMYKKKKQKEPMQIFDVESLSALQRNISKNLMKDISELKSEREQLSNFGDDDSFRKKFTTQKHEEDKSADPNEYEDKVGLNVSDEYNEFIQNNSEYFKSVKGDASMPSHKTFMKKHNRSKFSNLNVVSKLLTGSSDLAPVGNLFNKKMKKHTKSRSRKIQNLKHKTMEQKMRATQGFNLPLDESFPKRISLESDNSVANQYSYQNIDVNKLNMD